MAVAADAGNAADDVFLTRSLRMAKWFVTSLLLLGFWGWMVGPAAKRALAADDKPAAKESGAAKDKTEKDKPEKSGKNDEATKEASQHRASKREAAKGESHFGETTRYAHWGHHHGRPDAASKEHKRPSAEELFKLFDTNKDGTLSKEEFVAGMKKLEERIREKMAQWRGSPGPHHFGPWAKGPGFGCPWMHGHHGLAGRSWPRHPGMGGFGGRFGPWGWGHHFGPPGFGHHFGPWSWGHRFEHPKFGHHFGPWDGGHHFGPPGFGRHFGPGERGRSFGSWRGHAPWGNWSEGHGGRHFGPWGHGRHSEHTGIGRERGPWAMHRPFGEGDQRRAGPPSVGGWMERFDKNKDGKLTKDEVPEPLWERLSAAGAVKDGAVNKEGLEAALKKMHEHFQSRMPPITANNKRSLPNQVVRQSKLRGCGDGSCTAIPGATSTTVAPANLSYFAGSLSQNVAQPPSAVKMASTQPRAAVPQHAEHRRQETSGSSLWVPRSPKDASWP